MKRVYIRNISALKVVASLCWVVMIAITIDMLCLPVRAQHPAFEVDTAIFLREAKELQEILVSPGSDKYSDKDNAALELIKKIRQDQKKGDPRLLDHYSYDKYDKITLGLLDISERDLESHESLKAYLDTTEDGRRLMLKVLLNEQASSTQYSKAGKERKDVVKEKKSNGISEMFDVGNIEVFLDDMLREVDIYDNDVTLMSNRFPSPLSSSGRLHYRYFIADTLDVEGTRCIQVTFLPRNPAAFSFSGNLYVELGDTTGFIRKVSMKVPRTVNINFIDNLHIEQLYEKDASGKRHKVSDKVYLDLCIIKGTQRFSAARNSKYGNFSYRLRSDIERDYDEVGQYIEIGSPSRSHGDLLTYMRGADLSDAEENMHSFMGDLRKYPFFYWGEKVLVVLVTGYIKTGKKSYFDIGPINTLISTNPIEGVRLRLGGMTTANLSPHWFANGYLAYGVDDRKWKYKAEVEYSFLPKKYHSREFPVNSLRLTHMYDLDMIGQHYHFTNPDNVFLSLKRMKDRLATYRHLTRLEYGLELRNRLSFSFWGEHIRQDPSPWLTFIRGDGSRADGYQRSSIGLSLRYAPGEKFIDEKGSRVAVNRDAPVMQVIQEFGPSGLGISHYSVCKTEFSIWKRFWFSSFGYLDALLKGGVIWSKVPFTELLWPNANLSYTIQPESYSLMNPMEFAMDRYVSGDFSYWGNGVLFNRLPLIRKAKLREVVGFKCLWGGLSRRNNPAHDSSLFRFPDDADVSVLGSTPYMEVSVGIDNIFKILRIDYVWRLSYLHSSATDRSGLRVALHFTF